MPYWAYIIIGVGVALIIACSIVVLLLKKKKPKIKIDSAYINELVSDYGGITNITDTQVDNGRLKVTVKDLSIVKLEELKAIANGGIFVTGNTIKTLYRLDSKTIKEAIDNMG